MNNYFLFLPFNFVFKNLNLPIFITLIRLILIPFICIYINLHQFNQAFVFFIIAILTDVADGALARFTNSETILGAYLDPLADKCLMLASFWTISLGNFTYFQVPLWFNLFLFFKEILLIMAVAYFGLFRNTIKVKPTYIGKATNFVQSICVFLFFISALFKINLGHMLNIILLAITGLSLIALFHYFWLGYGEITNEY